MTYLAISAAAAQVYIKPDTRSGRHLPYSTMRIFSLLPTALSALCTIGRTAVPASPPPEFETLFVGKFAVAGETLTTNGPFGTRVHVPISGSVL